VKLHSHVLLSLSFSASSHFSVVSVSVFYNVSDSVIPVESPKKGSLPRGESVEHFYWLDWLRFTAALLVVVCHARGSTWAAWGELDQSSQTKLSAICFGLSRPGLEAVVVFFCLSGFLVGGRLVERWRNDQFDFRRYALDRISRIYVPLIPALIVTAVVSLFLGFAWSWGELAGNLCGLQGLTCSAYGGNAPLWSLSYEIWFYILAGCFALAVDPRKPFGLLPWLSLTIAFAVFTKLNATYLLCWIIGAISYLCIGKTLRWPAILGAFCLTIIGVAVSQLTSGTKSIAIGPSVLALPRDVAIIALSAGIAILLAYLAPKAPQSAPMAFFERLGSTLAAFSYTLYLIHYPLIQLLTRLVKGPFVRIDTLSQTWFWGKVLLSMVAAWLLYLPFEAQTIRMRRWLTSVT
jgi:peptidoglycan/LPS O-acetylase OafA/YrhL